MIADGECFATLRNVAPPEPEPVLREAWVWWASSGKATVSLNEEWCIHQRTVECGVYARVAVMSDGSPVPASPEQIDHMREMAAFITERDSWKAQCEAWAAKATEWTEERDRLKRQAKEDDVQIEHLQSSVEVLKDEVDKLHKANLRLLGQIGQMRPVVEAAVEMSAHFSKATMLKLLDVVHAYQSTPKKTAAEAVANVAAMMGPMKTCNNCLHDRNGVCAVEVDFGFDENGDCQDWEMKQ